MYRPAAHIQDDELYLPAGQLGMGWWGDAWDEVKSVAKKVQANPVVRGLEKKAVDYGSKALRGAAEGAVDGLADSALSAVGAPELAPMADKLIDKGASYLQKKGTDYLKQEIDASGSGVRHMVAGEDSTWSPARTHESPERCVLCLVLSNPLPSLLAILS